MVKIIRNLFITAAVVTPVAGGAVVYSNIRDELASEELFELEKNRIFEDLDYVASVYDLDMEVNYSNYLNKFNIKVNMTGIYNCYVDELEDTYWNSLHLEPEVLPDYSVCDFITTNYDSSFNEAQNVFVSDVEFNYEILFIKDFTSETHYHGGYLAKSYYMNFYLGKQVINGEIIWESDIKDVFYERNPNK